MITKDEALKLALEALESYHGYMEPLTTVFGGPRIPAEQSTTGKVERAITAIREALAEQPAQQDSTCSKTLREQGKACPRTCKKCGLGPCIADRVQPAQQQEQKPYGYVSLEDGNKFQFDKPEIGIWKPVYTTPPHRKPWVGLSDEEIDAIISNVLAATSPRVGYRDIARAIEAKHGIKG